MTLNFAPKLVNTFYVFRVNIKKICLACSKKLIDKYSQAVVGWCKGRSFIYPQFLVAIGVVDLIQISHVTLNSSISCSLTLETIGF